MPICVQLPLTPVIPVLNFDPPHQELSITRRCRKGASLRRTHTWPGVDQRRPVRAFPVPTLALILLLSCSPKTKTLEGSQRCTSSSDYQRHRRQIKKSLKKTKKTKPFAWSKLLNANQTVTKPMPRLEPNDEQSYFQNPPATSLSSHTSSMPQRVPQTYR